jgi:guanylate kinase
MKRLERLERLRQIMSDKEILEELVRAMSDKTADEYFDYIVSNNEIEED